MFSTTPLKLTPTQLSFPFWHHTLNHYDLNHEFMIFSNPILHAMLPRDFGIERKIPCKVLKLMLSAQ